MGMSDEAFYAELNADSFVRLGKTLPENFQTDCTARLYREVAERLVEVPGAKRTVSSLRHRKAVASSSTGEKLAIKLRKAGLWDLFAPHIFSADDVERAKPAPDLFLHSATALGVRPEQCLVLEDSVNGVRAARAAGMQVWGFAGGGHMDGAAHARLVGAGAARLVSDWAEAETLFSTL
jgi:HAD superfamily hydrolase (TIGR01509 family)